MVYVCDHVCYPHFPPPLVQAPRIEIAIYNTQYYVDTTFSIYLFCIHSLSMIINVYNMGKCKRIIYTLNQPSVAALFYRKM